MEKNWKKLISRRRVRLESVVKDSQTEPSQAGAGAQSDATTTTPATTGVTDEANAVANGTTKPPEKKEGGEKSTSAPAATAATGDVKATENGARKPKQEKKPDSETMDLAKRQLLVRRICILAVVHKCGAEPRLTLVLCIDIDAGAGGETEVARGAKAREVSSAEEHSRGGSALQEQQQHIHATRRSPWVSSGEWTSASEEATHRSQRREWDVTAGRPGSCTFSSEFAAVSSSGSVCVGHVIDDCIRWDNSSSSRQQQRVEAHEGVVFA